MYMLQLFDRDEALPVDVRLLREGKLKIGRDPAVDWTIADPDCAISRAHCELEVAADGLRLTPTGANGVFDDATGARFTDGQSCTLPIPGAIRLGRFRIATLDAPHADDGDVNRTLVLTPPLGTSTVIPADWADAAPVPAQSLGEGSLLEAFCEGAGLDPSRLLDEEPTEIMRRAGAVYRQMVLGVSDLMAERDSARQRYQLTRTTIGGAGNNPFKWAPTQRLAIDLLLAGTDSFLSGPAAIRASFGDVKRHLVATFAGLQGSLRAAIDSFDPNALDQAAGKRGGLLKSRASGALEEAVERHADLKRQIDEGADGTLDRAFVVAYDLAEAKLKSKAE
jgi:predicted component of type VI protein secretion system